MSTAALLPRTGQLEVDPETDSTASSPMTRSTPTGGASKSQPRPRIVGRPIYLGERKAARSTCRDEVVDAVEVLAVGRGERSFAVEEVYAVMVASGTSWSPGDGCEDHAADYSAGPAPAFLAA